MRVWEGFISSLRHSAESSWTYQLKFGPENRSKAALPFAVSILLREREPEEGVRSRDQGSIPYSAQNARKQRHEECGDESRVIGARSNGCLIAPRTIDAPM